MRKILISVAILVVMFSAHPRRASAGGSKGSFGVGFEEMLHGPGGASVNYDAGKFHVGGFFGFANNDFIKDGDRNASNIDFGGRFYFHVHSTAMSDFGIGGSLGYLNAKRAAPDNDFQNLYFDLGAQIRLFMVSNVALSATIGIAIGVSDANGVALDGQPVGGFGIHYYFF